MSATLFRRHARLQLLEPVEHDLNLRSRRRAGHRILSGRDDTEESLAVARDVVVSLERWAALDERSRQQHPVAEVHGEVDQQRRPPLDVHAEPADAVEQIGQACFERFQVGEGRSEG